VAAAEAGALLQFVFRRPWQGVVAPLAGYAIRAGKQLAVQPGGIGVFDAPGFAWGVLCYG